MWLSVSFSSLLFSAVTINKGSGTLKAGMVSLRNKLQHSHYAPAVNTSTPLKWALLCARVCARVY